MASLRKRTTAKLVGTTPVVNLDGETVATARLEKSGSGHIIAHIDLKHQNIEVIRDGFTLGKK